MKRRDEVTVGILLTVAVVVLITGTLWLVRGGLRRGYPLHTQFPWGQNLKQGQAVMLAGVTVGYVDDVRLLQGVIDVDLIIQTKYKVPKPSHTEVYPVGIFGDVAVAIKPEHPGSVSYQPGDTIPSRPAAGGLDALQARADTVITSLSRITRAVEAEFVADGGLRDIRRTISSMNGLVADMRTVVNEQNRSISSLVGNLRRTTSAVDSAKVASTLESFRQTSASADSLMQRLSSNTTQLQAILARLERGEGTVGKLMTDSLLYRDARNLLTQVDSLVADFKRNPRKYINLSVF
jgi:phospholipid/cholesterol/gamma-HCH transport system substrate-binding protein